MGGSFAVRQSGVCFNSRAKARRLNAELSRRAFVAYYRQGLLEADELPAALGS